MGRGSGGGGVATGAGSRVDVTLKLPQLQNFCKRDPAGYREDYDAQIRRLRAECDILALSPSSDPSASLVELIQFAAAVSSSSYKGKEADQIADLLINLLLGSSSSTAAAANKHTNFTASRGPVQMTMPTSTLQLHRDVRKACVSALILMRNKGAVPPLRLLELFFRIMAVVPDKALRELLYRHIVTDVRNINKKGKRDEKVNRSVQSFLHRVVQSQDDSSYGDGEEESATDIAAKRATDMVCELYRRNVWTDERTVAILASACVSRNTTVMCRAIRFFLNIEEKMAEDRKREEDDEWHGINQIDFHQHSKKTKTRMRQVAKQIKNRKKMQQKKEQMEEDLVDKGVEASKKLYPAIEMLRDPQGLVEAVFKRLRAAGSYKYEVKLLMMNFVTRLVGNHELLLLPLYPFLQRYMLGHQRDVTAVLAYCVQACHEYVPPDEIYGILKTIAHNFITERCSGEQMAVGINAARAICARIPSVLSVEDSQDISGRSSTVMDVEAFARDLAAYSNHRDRSVSIAGRGWTNFIREVYPSLLQGKDRGSTGSALHRAGEKPLRYGEKKIAAGVAGADLLVEYEAKKAQYLKNKKSGNNGNGDNDSEGSQEERMNDEPESDDEDVDRAEVEEDSEDEVAPDLVLLQGIETEKAKEAEGGKTMDLSKMSAEERKKLQQEVSATRVFTAADFEKMRKLIEREEKAKRDPRAAARRKRAVAHGKEFEELSDDDDDIDSDSDDEVHVAGAVNPLDIMALAKKKRMSKAEKLETIIAGRHKFEQKKRDGGSTNVEKKRKKNFVMTKYSHQRRSKRSGKDSVRALKKRKTLAHNRDAKKRRRKL